MPVNTIKIQQIDTGQLYSFMLSGLGIYSGTLLQHTTSEDFLANLNVGQNFTTSGNARVEGASTFLGDVTMLSNLMVEGLISGFSLYIDNFSLPTGEIGAATVSGLKFKNLPIYDSGNIASGLALSSGTIFGVRQKINNPIWEFDTSGNLMPSLETGVTVVMLCMSLG